MGHKLLVLLICVLVLSPQWACTCGAHEPPAEGSPLPPHEHDHDCPAVQPVPKWKAVKPAAPDLPAADAGPAVVLADHVAQTAPAAPFAPASPFPPGVPIDLSAGALRN